jgi:hypothetical protein
VDLEGVGEVEPGFAAMARDQCRNDTCSKDTHQD